METRQSWMHKYVWKLRVRGLKLQESRVNAAWPRTISVVSVDKKKISSGTQGSVACAILVVASYKEGIFWKRYRFVKNVYFCPRLIH